MEEKVTQIRDDLRPDVQKLAMLIAHHESILSSIKAELANLLRLSHGVNLADPGTILDADGGVIVQRRSAPSEPPLHVVEADEEKVEA